MIEPQGQVCLKILHLEDNVVDAELVRDALDLEEVSCEVKRVVSRHDFEAALREGSFDIILSDYSLPGFNGMSALTIAKTIQPDLPFIFVSGTIGEECAVESLQNGAVDYVLKDRTSRLVSAIQRAHQESLDRRRRREIEDQLRERNELFRQITESVDDLIAVVDLNGSALFTSPSYIGVVGPGTESTRFFKNVIADDISRVTNLFREVVTAGAAKRLGYRVLDVVGRIRHLESQWSAIRNQHGKITSVVIVSRDVTEREEAARMIREQAELLNQARDAIFVRDLDQHITYWNRGAERVYGWKAGEVLGRCASDFLCKTGTPNRDDIGKAIFEKGEWQGELSQITKEGKEICISSRRTLLRNGRGEPSAILNINTDVTEKKNLEGQVLRSQRLDSIGSLASGIAHDLNNVLAPILMATELVRDRITDDESRRMLDVAKGSARRGADLVKQVLQFARGTKGDHAIVNLQTLVKELGKFAKNTFPPLITIQTKFGEGNLDVLGDATQIHQVLLNLCVNARDAMPKGGSLVIEARELTLNGKVFKGQAKPVSGRYVEVSVHDTGTGIPAEILPKVFEPFFTTKSADKGTGLGLSTVATIIQNHRGFIDISTKIDKGTTFYVYFPGVTQQADSKQATTEPEVPMGKGEWILIVDDELALLEMMKELLEAYGYNVLAAKDGSEALVQFGANRSKIRVVITDLLMPGVGGQQLIDTIRKVAPNVISICVSGSADEDVIRSDSSGATAFLRKPCPTNELLATLAKLLNR
jgi:PAS domain S-box-containing protein